MVRLVLIHGAGYSRTTFAALLPLLSDEYADIRAVDLPGHGCSSANAYDMEAYVSSIKEHITADTILVGHSLGGSVATFFAEALAVILIDITEAPAIRSLDNIPFALSRRPSSFADLAAACDWYRKQCPRCKIPLQSISGQLVKRSDSYGWRVDLLGCREEWRGWFVGMDDRFLACRNPLLVLTDRELLDKTLLIASMQGKFQLSIISNSGHAVQEDQPELLASIIKTHIARITRLENALQPACAIPRHEQARN